MIFIIIIFSLIFGFCFYSKRFSNPHKLIFYLGKKGSGKSTCLIKDMLKFKKKGWNIYTDISDVNIPGVHVINVKDLEKFVPPPHTCLYLDEVGISFDNRNFKQFPAGMRDFWKFQRKYKIRAVVNSQSWDVDVKLRSLTDQFYLQTNIGNVIGISRPIRRKITVTEATSQGESRIADQLYFGSIFSWKWTWLPRYFKYFKSFDAPPRELIPSTLVEVEQEEKLLKRIMRKHWSRK